MALGIMHTLHVVRPRFQSEFVRWPHFVHCGGIGLNGWWPSLFGVAVRLRQSCHTKCFPSIPGYWYQTADYLAQRAATTALVVPASAHGLYTWGWTIDEPLEALAQSPWVDREFVPYGGAGSTRVIDAIDQALRTGLPQPWTDKPVDSVGDLIRRGSKRRRNRSFRTHLPLTRSIGFSARRDCSWWLRSGQRSETLVEDRDPTLKPVHSGFEVSYPTIQIFKVHGNVRPIIVPDIDGHASNRRTRIGTSTLQPGSHQHESGRRVNHELERQPLHGPTSGSDRYAPKRE